MKGLDKRHLRGKLYVMSMRSFASTNTGCKHISFKTNPLLLYFIRSIPSGMDTVHSTVDHSGRLKEDSDFLIYRLAEAKYVTVKEIKMLFIGIDVSLGCHMERYLLKASQAAVKNHIPSIRLDVYEKQRLTVY